MSKNDSQNFARTGFTNTEFLVANAVTASNASWSKLTFQKPGKYRIDIYMGTGSSATSKRYIQISQSGSLIINRNFTYTGAWTQYPPYLTYEYEFEEGDYIMMRCDESSTSYTTIAAAVYRISE